MRPPLLLVLLILAGLVATEPATSGLELVRDEVRVRVIRLETTGEIMVDVGECTRSKLIKRECWIKLDFERMDFGTTGTWRIAPFSDTSWVTVRGEMTLSGYVLRNETTGAVHVAAEGQVLRVEFPEPEMRLEGRSSVWVGAIFVEPRITLWLTTSSDLELSLDSIDLFPQVTVWVEPNHYLRHQIGGPALSVWLEMGETGQTVETLKFIAPGERRGLTGPGGSKGRRNRLEPQDIRRTG